MINVLPASWQVEINIYTVKKKLYVVDDSQILNGLAIVFLTKFKSHMN